MHDLAQTDPSDTQIDPISVVIIHDYQLFADGLRAGLEAELDLYVVAMITDVADALVIAQLHRPDVVVVDYALGAANGLDLGQAIADDCPEIKVLLLTGTADHDNLAAQAVAKGFAGVLHRQATMFETIHAIRQLHQGNNVFTPQDLTRALAYARNCGSRRPTDLTDRENEVFQLVAAGESTGKIAAALFVSPHTVRSHVRSILVKLDTHSKVEAVAAGYRRGLITPP